MIKMIAAVSRNGVIGKDGFIPWWGNYPEDMKHFQKMTRKSTVIMGRKTWESLGITAPLPQRKNIIVTKLPKSYYWMEKEEIENINVIATHSISEAIEQDETCWLIGGASIYEEGMTYASEIYLTIIPEVVTGGDLVRFPWIDPTKFKIESVTPFETDERLRLVKYVRI